MLKPKPLTVRVDKEEDFQNVTVYAAIQRAIWEQLPLKLIIKRGIEIPAAEAADLAKLKDVEIVRFTDEEELSGDKYGAIADLMSSMTGRYQCVCGYIAKDREDFIDHLSKQPGTQLLDELPLPGMFKKIIERMTDRESKGPVTVINLSRGGGKNSLKKLMESFVRKPLEFPGVDLKQSSVRRGDIVDSHPLLTREDLNPFNFGMFEEDTDNYFSVAENRENIMRYLERRS